MKTKQTPNIKVVNCRTEDEAKELFEILAKDGYTWIDNEKICATYTLWKVHESNTCYEININDKSIAYGHAEVYKADGQFPVITFDEFKNQLNNKNMKYKEGDVVRIKSKTWYEANKDEDGNVKLPKDVFFWKEMQHMLGNTYLIKWIEGNFYQLENGFYINDDIIEGLAIEETPTISTNLIKDIAEVIKTHNWGVSISEKEGKLIIEPLEKEEDLPIDTPCMVADELIDWRFRYYACKRKVFTNGYKFKDGYGTVMYDYIIPFDKFNPNDIEESLKYNIVK